MKKLITIVLISSYFLAVPNIGYTVQGAPYAPGELLVKYKSSVRAVASEYYRAMWDISSIRSFKKIGIQHVKLPEEMTVKEALEIYRSNPDVEYVEPNYYRHITATPNDAYFGRLWGLHNTGQSVDGISGTADADIDAPEAWNITTGSSNVVVAVIDSGVDYNHPDLSANIWTNTGEVNNNGIDNDDNGYVDDVRGWDFADGDNDPVDSHGHGTHVAGIIAAVGNNSVGIAGVSWTAKIMVLRVINAFGNGTTSDVISAIEYANDREVDVINLSIGSYGFSQAEKDAIDASSAVVVCAAGNDGNNNDTSPHYPSSYTSSNIIAVAASDQDDDIASFSNFGTTSVDVSEPGTNIYSTKPGIQTVWSDNFDDNDISDWTTAGTNNTWSTTNSLSYSGSYSLTDSPAGNYQNNTDSWVRAPVLNLSSYNGTKLEFKLRGTLEYYTGTLYWDFIYVQISTDLSSWTNQNILIDGVINSRVFEPTYGYWLDATVDLGTYDGNSTVYIRFRFISDSSVTEDGFYFDDIVVTAASSSYNGTEYQYGSGSSMATPFVSGVAALIKAHYSSLTNTEIKAQIENTVDSKASLSGKVATGGRVNAANALVPPTPTGLSATAASASQIDLSWSENSPNETGFKIERKTGSGGTYSQTAAVGANVTSYSDAGLSASTTYYYRVRSYNSTGNSSYSSEASATISSPGGGSGGGGGCFIATAAYGSSMEPHVKILREFRDRFLLNNSIGKAFVQLYYTYSPPIADFIAKHANLRAMVRLSLLPIVGMSWVALKFGLFFTLAMTFLLIFGIMYFSLFRKKLKKQLN